LNFFFIRKKVQRVAEKSRLHAPSVGSTEKEQFSRAWMACYARPSTAEMEKNSKNKKISARPRGSPRGFSSISKIHPHIDHVEASNKWRLF